MNEEQGYATFSAVIRCALFTGLTLLLTPSIIAYLTDSVKNWMQLLMFFYVGCGLFAMYLLFSIAAAFLSRMKPRLAHAQQWALFIITLSAAIYVLIQKLG
jgi:hypothetical protein